MTLQPPGRARERIMTFGLEGCGKSLAALDIARATTSTVWVVDNDNAWDRMLEDADWAGVQVSEEWRYKSGELVADDRFTTSTGNVALLHVDGWAANIAAIEHVVEHAGVDDWLVIDSATALWSDVQDWYTETVFNEGIEDYFLQVRLKKQEASKDKKSLGAFDGWMDWPVINAQYKKKVGAVMVNPPCHLYITCEQQEISSEDDRETRGLYGEMGFKPRGQKRTGHNVQTVIWLGRKRGGVWHATTVKDRGGRDLLEGFDVTDGSFAEWYLRDVAGWTEHAAIAEVAAPRVIKKKG